MDKPMPCHSITFFPLYPGVILIKYWFPININSISIIFSSFLSMSISISITKTAPYQYQYLINFSKFSLSISIPISILQFFPINISLSMHCATLIQRMKGFEDGRPQFNRQKRSRFWSWDLTQELGSAFQGMIFHFSKFWKIPFQMVDDIRTRFLFFFDDFSTECF